LGSSPGGASQALLEQELRVVGIDPAVMHERVLQHPNFTHVRARAADLKRKEFAEVRWLMADANLAPGNTLEAIEDIVTNRRVNIHGMLITLKLLDMKMIGDIDNHLQRIRSWGYRHVRARQLAFNRREVCVMAVKSKGRLHFGRKRKSTD
jgi:23S rRNA (cytidine2498-2'-O)-methyltransferase